MSLNTDDLSPTSIESSNISNLPADLLRPILDLLPAQCIALLYLCGCERLNERMRRQDIVKSFRLTYKEPTGNCKWPSIVSAFSQLETLVLEIPFPYGHLPFDKIDVKSIPKSTTDLTLHFGNANDFVKPALAELPNLLRLRSDGSYCVFSRYKIPETIQSFELPGFQVPTPTLGHLTTLLGDISLSLESLIHLPPTLTKLGTVCIVGWQDRDEEQEMPSGAFPPGLTHLDLDDGPSHLILPLLPPGLKLLRMKANAVCDFTFMPRELENLDLTSVEDPSVCEPLNFAIMENLPKTLTRLKLRNFHHRSMASYLTTSCVKAFIAPHQTMKSEELALLPASLEYLCVSGIRDPPVLIPPRIRRFKMIQKVGTPQLPTLHLSEGLASAILSAWQPKLTSLPSTLTFLHCHATHGQVNSNMFPAGLRALSLHSTSRASFEGPIVWPSGMTSIHLTSFLVPDFFDVPPTLTSLQLKFSGTTDINPILDRIPATLQHLTLPEYDIQNEHVSRLPKRLVRLSACVEITEAGVQGLPKTLAYCGPVKGDPASPLAELFPDYCEVKWRRSW